MGNFSQIIESNLSILLIVFGVLILALASWNTILHLKIARGVIKNFSPEEEADAKSAILSHSKTLKLLDKDIQELYNISNQINSLAFKGLHKVGMIRFNPFKDVGGDQSFSIALLNGKNNGVTITSLYTREGARFYSKSIQGGKSEKHPLTNEEKEAIKIAMSQEIKHI